MQQMTYTKSTRDALKRLNLPIDIEDGDYRPPPRLRDSLRGLFIDWWRDHRLKGRP
jgi:hypothetical protein